MKGAWLSHRFRPRQLAKLCSPPHFISRPRKTTLQGREDASSRDGPLYTIYEMDHQFTAVATQIQPAETPAPGPGSQLAGGQRKR